jgi:hypothetical protein
MKTILQIENITRAELEELIAKSRPAQSSEKAEKIPLSSRELARKLNVTGQTLVRWRKQGLIPYYGHGKHIYHYLDEVEQALRGNPKLNK